MKKIIKIILLCALVFPLTIYAQEKKGNTFGEIKKEREAYFKEYELKHGHESLEEEGGEYNQYKRWVRYWEMRIKLDQTIEDYVAKISQISNSNNQSIQSSTISSNKSLLSSAISDPWTELGPTNIPASGDASIGGGQRGIGPIQYITFYKPTPSRMLASSLAGGLFVSSDFGATWQNAGSDKWTISGCTSAAFSPTSSNTWYGCSNLGGNNNRHGAEIGFAIGPGGVWRTNNAGTSYDLIGDQYDFTTLGANTTIHKILVDPTLENVGYVATTGGLYKTLNLTTLNPTWSLIQTGNIEDIEFKTDNSKVLIISRQQTFTPPPSGYYISNDWVLEVSFNWGGTSTSGTWSYTTSIPSGGFIANMSSTECGNIELTTTEANPDLIYLVDLKNAGPSGNLYTFNISTGNYTLRYAFLNMSFGLGRAFGVSNVSQSTVYVGNTIGFSKSTDYGATFTYYSTFPAGGINAYHSDVEYITSPFGVDVFIATHGGVSYSPDACVSILPSSNGLGVAEVWGMSQTDAKHQKIVMGLDHDGTVLSDEASPASYPLLAWETVYGGDGMNPFIDNTNSNYVHVAPLSPDPGTTYLFSNTGGHSGTYSTAPVCDTKVHDIQQNKVLENYLYYKSPPYSIGTPYMQLFRSNDNGTVNAGVQLTNFSAAWGYTSMSIQEVQCAPSNPNYIYMDVVVNGATHIMLRNTNVNAAAATVQTSWQILSPTGLIGTGPSAIDQFDPNIIYTSQWGPGIYKCDFTNPLSPIVTNITKNLPPYGAFVRELVFEEGSNSGLYAGGPTGVWYTNAARLSSATSATDAWVKMTSLPNCTVNSIAINYTTNKLRVATSGRGLWEHDLICPTFALQSFSGVPIAPNFYEANVITATNSTLQNGGPKIFRGVNYVQLNPGFIATSSGTNNYFLAFIHGCSASGNTLRLLDQGNVLSSDELEEGEENESVKENDLSIYPNPNNGNFKVDFSLSKASENLQLIVTNSMGQTISTQKINNHDGTVKFANLNLAGARNGIYVVTLLGDDIIKSKRFIITNNK
jgi:Secretion system C-terminal sorting domain